MTQRLVRDVTYDVVATRERVSDGVASAMVWANHLGLSRGSLSQVAADMLRAMIRDGRLAPGAKLPGEPKLASNLKVSRGTLRSAIHQLEQQGLVWKRRGVGTFVSARRLLHNRLDLYLSLTDLIESTGRKPGVSDLSVEVIPADDHTAENLQAPLNAPVVCLRRTRTADDVAVIANIDYFLLAQLGTGSASDLLRRLTHGLEELGGLQRFFERELGRPLDHAITTIRPVRADHRLLQEIRLPITRGAVLLCLEQTDYDRFQHPLITGFEYHVPEFCDCTIYRHR
ncbi:MAG: putative HTH-type transcriptional regulator YurK [Chloroflexi bacterium ADurb.Bin180]|nr:MAG: putative HTH-type transcriptional regulator YurK [Chloroflexi bacterium ADurb.Bin180]